MAGAIAALKQRISGAQRLPIAILAPRVHHRAGLTLPVAGQVQAAQMAVHHQAIREFQPFPVRFGQQR
jgi:hypothetical protein